MSRTILVVGAGISGTTAAVEAAEAGFPVCLVESSPFLGGRVARLARYFPKLCPPSCGLEINHRRLRRAGVDVLTLAQVERIDGEPGAYEARVRLAPRFVTERCTGCGACVEVCPVARPDEWSYGMGRTKAIFAPPTVAFPPWYAIDAEACSGIECGACVPACPMGAIDLAMKARVERVEAGAVVVATGFRPYDASRLEGLGFGAYPDVVTGVMMERLAAPDGPTGGRILCPSTGRSPASVAFVQCAGSRDERHLPHCSAVCCLASLKQATYVRAQLPEARVSIFYIDLRAPGRNEALLGQVARDERVSLRRGKVARVDREEGAGLVVEAEDTATGRRTRERADLVVLATGMEPSLADERGLSGVERDEQGFVVPDAGRRGIIACGCARAPMDVAAAVRDGTAAALRAISAARGT